MMSWCRLLKNYDNLVIGCSKCGIKMPAELDENDRKELSHMCLVLDPIRIGTKLIEGNGAKGICSLYFPAVDYILGEYETDQHLIFPKELDPGAVESDDVEAPIDGGKDGKSSSSSSSSSSAEESEQEDGTPPPWPFFPET